MANDKSSSMITLTDPTGCESINRDHEWILLVLRKSFPNGVAQQILPRDYIFLKDVKGVTKFVQDPWAILDYSSWK
jgi:hypothetical protein